MFSSPIRAKRQICIETLTRLNSHFFIRLVIELALTSSLLWRLLMEFFRAKLSGIQFIERLDDRNCVSDFGQWTAPKRMDVVDWRDWTP